MTLNIMLLFLFTVALANNIWAVYGVGLARRDISHSSCYTCTPHQTTITTSTSSYIPRIQWLSQPSLMTASNTTLTQASDVVIAVDTRSSPTPSPLTSHSTTNPPQTIMTSTTITTTTSAPPDAPSLSAGGAVGIGFGLAALMLIFAFIILGVPSFHRWRRTRARQHEVESGVDVNGSMGSPSVPKVKENMVLESRVEIVIEDEVDTVDVLDAWNGWDATGEHEEKGWDERKGVSLSRREM